MLIDSETNFLYLSEQLKLRYNFFSELTSLLSKEKIQYRLLTKTNDIWAVDYMPIQIDQDKFVQFRYEPDYLQNDKFILTQTDAKLACDSIGIETIDGELKIDGGNVIKGKGWVILTDKIFKENQDFKRSDVIDKIEVLFQVRVIIIPQDLDDFIGHADGMVRYYSNDTVLINQYEPGDQPVFQKRLKTALRNQGVGIIEIPYNPYGNKNYESADGLYINFLQMENFVLVPIFALRTDEKVIRQFEQLFPNHKIMTIDCREISRYGGVLNCITWNIKASEIEN